MYITTQRMKPDGTIGFFEGERELTPAELAARQNPKSTGAVQQPVPMQQTGLAAVPAATAPAAQTIAPQVGPAAPDGPDQATVNQLMAVYRANPQLVTKIGEGEGGETFAQAQGTTVNGYTIALDPNTNQPYIFKPLKEASFGNEVTAVYDTSGKFQGNSSGDSTNLGLAKFVAGAFGMYNAGVGLDSFINGAAGGAGQGAVSGMDMMADNPSWWDKVGTINTSNAGTMLDAATNANYGNEGRNYPTPQSTQGPGGSPVNAGQVASTAATAATSSNGLGGGSPSGTGSPFSNGPGTGWDTLGKLAGTALTVGGAVAAGNAASNPVGTGKFDQLFQNLLAEQSKVSGRGDDQWNAYLSTFRPLEQKMAKSALEYDQPWRREQAANEAMNTVANQFDQQRQASAEEMARMGMDGATIAMLGDSSRIIEAKARAGAANNARTQVEQTGLGLVRDAAQFGRQLPGTAMQASGVATGTAGTASGIASSQAQIQNQNTQNRNAMIGDILGAGLQAWGMFGSSKKTKKVGKKVSGLAAVKAVEGSPASEWKYKPGEGDGDTKQRMGPMAEDLEREAPGVSDGEQVDAISMLGLHHAAIAGLAQEVRGLKRIAAGRA